MAIVFDAVKSARNFAERGLAFDLVEWLDWDGALVREDVRRDYGETRLQVWAVLEGQLVAVVVTPRGEDLRVISLRRASRKEERAYEEWRGGQGAEAR